MFALGPLLLLWPLAAALQGSQELGDKVIIQREAQFNKDYNDSVNSELQNIYAFNHTVFRNKTEGVRVSVNILSEQKGTPLLFGVRQKESVVSFQVPLTLRGL
ncbi:hypothetical protein FKM82_020901 [Ascaphus truei]